MNEEGKSISSCEAQTTRDVLEPYPVANSRRGISKGSGYLPRHFKPFPRQLRNARRGIESLQAAKCAESDDFSGS